MVCHTWMSHHTSTKLHCGEKTCVCTDVIAAGLQASYILPWNYR